MRTLLSLAGICLSISAVGCADDHTECPTENATITTFTITPDAMAAGDEVTGTVTVGNFTLTGDPNHHDEQSIGAQPQSEDGHDGDAECATGHIHVYIDDLMTNPLIQATTSEFMFHIPMDATAGTHTLMGRIHNADHTIYSPETIAEVDITVQ